MLFQLYLNISSISFYVFQNAEVKNIITNWKDLKDLHEGMNIQSEKNSHWQKLHMKSNYII